ncbi:MAG: ssDNA-binding domain-containing protein [Oscillospiraceae bacterium]|jgi:hypothetical protein|nr:ssDNA-binding domain-containing protein [Oscillospiraceae bacterium]
MPDVTVRDLTSKLEQGVKDLFQSDKYAAYLQTMSRFHNYSSRNVLLIHMQYPSATRVASYLSWKNNFNRQVKKGEHGIKILAPIPRGGETKEFEKIDPVTKKPVLDENGQPVMETLTSLGRVGFKTVNVFAYEQTDGEPLPALVEPLTGDVERYELFMDALRAVSPLPIVFEDMPPNTDGTCYFGDRIAIRNGMSQVQTVSAVVHEIAHATIHDRSLAAEDSEPKSRRVEETEAESISFVICSRYGLETGANSFGYIAEYAKSRELKELNASLDTIRKASAELIDGIDKQYQAFAKERGIDLSVVADEVGAEQNLNMPDDIVNNDPPKAEEVPAAEQEAPPPPPAPSLPDILAGYARNAQVRDPRQIGLTILMPLLFEDGNLNRAAKRSRVKVEPLIGKYEMFSREMGTPPYATNYLYLMSASGYLVQLGESERLKDLTEQRIDAFILDAATRLDRQLAEPTEWADFAAAAILNRINDAEAHNVPVREMREAERQAEREAQQESDRRLAIEKEQILNARIDEIAKAVETGKRINVAYDAGEHRGKNPVLELFKLYGVEIPLRTQGWVNSRLATIDGDSYSYYKQNSSKPSSVFMECLHKLRLAVKHTPIEQKRGLPAPQQSTEKPEVKDILEHELYKKFAAMFPEFMDGEYDTLRLEAEHAKPLELEWVFGDTVSIAHTYELNGEPAFEPLVLLKVNSAEKTMTASMLEITQPQRIDVVDSGGRVNLEMQRNINSFTSQWLDRAAKQRFRPVEAAYAVDEHGNASKAGLTSEKIVKVKFDAEGRPVLPELGSKPQNTAAHRLFEKLSGLFPDFAEGKYSYMRLEAQGYEPLSLEWLGVDRFSMMHTYTMNGDLMYDPMITFTADHEARTMTAVEFEQSMPPLYQRVTEDNGDGLSVDGNGNQRNVSGLQRQIDDFASDWFKNLAEQGHMPVKAHLVIGEDEEVAVTFDTDGNVIMPEAEPEAQEPPVPAKPNLMFPDPTITPAQRDEYGYTESSMHPLNREKALELFDEGKTVYMLYPDNTESMVFEREEIIAFTEDGGLCGIEHADWQHSGDFKTQAILSGFREDAKESDLLFGSESKFGIYQIPDYIDFYRDVRFAPIRELEAQGLTPNRNHYKLVYTAPLNQAFFNGMLPDHNRTLEAVFAKFQDNRPADFTERSVSVSDVIVLQWRGEVSAHFVDSFGFKELPSFTGNEREKAAEPTLSQNETRSKRAEQQRPAPKAPQTLLGELAEAKKAIEKGSPPNNHKPNEREV